MAGRQLALTNALVSKRLFMKWTLNETLLGLGNRTSALAPQSEEKSLCALPPVKLWFNEEARPPRGLPTASAYWWPREPCMGG